MAYRAAERKRRDRTGFRRSLALPLAATHRQDLRNCPGSVGCSGECWTGSSQAAFARRVAPSRLGRCRSAFRPNPTVERSRTNGLPRPMWRPRRPCGQTNDSHRVLNTREPHRAERECVDILFPNRSRLETNPRIWIQDPHSLRTRPNALRPRSRSGRCCR